MAGKKKILPLKEWEDSLNNMNYGELERIVADPDIYYKEYYNLAKKKMDELSLIPEYKAMKDTFIKCLEELGCKCEEGEDGEIEFKFQGKDFFIELDEGHHYIDINQYCWKRVPLDNVEEVERLKHAVNYANSRSSVTTVYFIDDEGKYIKIYCTTSILYRPMISNLKEHLDIRLNNFFLANDLVNTEMILKEERDKMKQEMFKMDKLPIC